MFTQRRAPRHLPSLGSPLTDVSRCEPGPKAPKGLAVNVRKNKLVSLAALGLVGGLALSACGGGSENGGTDGASDGGGAAGGYAVGV